MNGISLNATVRAFFPLTIDVTMYQCDSSDNVSCCSEATKRD